MASLPADNNFEKWCRKSGIAMKGCQVAQFNTTGRGIQATRPIRSGEIVIEVPDRIVLYLENHPFLSTRLRRRLHGKNETKKLVRLILCLMYEVQEAADSRWEGYIQYLPKCLSPLPMSWPVERQQQLLSGTSLYEKMHPSETERGLFHLHPPTDVEGMYRDYILPIIFHRLKGTSLRNLKREALYELYQWHHALVPVWDALNHITGKSNIRLNHSQKRAALQMIATRDIPSGEEIVNCFGELSSSELLRRYGFVEKGLKNPYNTAEISLRRVIRIVRFLKGEKDRNLERKITHLQKHSFIPPDGWFKIQSRSSLSTFHSTLRLLLISNAEWRELRWRTPNLGEITSFIRRYQLSRLEIGFRTAFDAPLSSERQAALSVRRDEYHSWNQFLQR